MFKLNLERLFVTYRCRNIIIITKSTNLYGVHLAFEVSIYICDVARTRDGAWYVLWRHSILDSRLHDAL